jgi:putative SOS response-associated peptidase YedK
LGGIAALIWVEGTELTTHIGFLTAGLAITLADVLKNLPVGRSSSCSGHSACGPVSRARWPWITEATEGWDDGSMCGRFVQAQDPSAYARHFGAEISTESLKASWNVAPTDQVYAVAEHEERRLLGTFRWGLIPWWAEDAGIGARHINARAESAATKPAFRSSFGGRRCLIPADGFFEWEKRPKGKLPHYIFRRDGDPLALAGLWASWRNPETEERLVTCTIITTEPNDLVGRLHDRMPVILSEEDWDRWLDRDFDDVEALQGMLGPERRGVLAEHPVSTLVNSVKNNFPECVEALEID